MGVNKLKYLLLLIFSAVLVSLWFFVRTNAAPETINIKGLEKVNKISGKIVATNKEGCCQPKTNKLKVQPRPKKKTPIKKKTYKKTKTKRKYYKGYSSDIYSDKVDCNSVGLNYSYNDCNPIVEEKEIPIAPAQKEQVDCDSVGMNYSYNDCNPQKQETEILKPEPEVVPATPIEESPPAIEPQPEELPVSGAGNLALLIGAPGLIVSLKNLRDSKRDLKKSLFKT